MNRFSPCQIYLGGYLMLYNSFPYNYFRNNYLFLFLPLLRYFFIIQHFFYCILYLKIRWLRYFSFTIAPSDKVIHNALHCFRLDTFWVCFNSSKQEAIKNHKGGNVGMLLKTSVHVCVYVRKYIRNVDAFSYIHLKCPHTPCNAISCADQKLRV